MSRARVSRIKAYMRTLPHLVATWRLCDPESSFGTKYLDVCRSYTFFVTVFHSFERTFGRLNGRGCVTQARSVHRIVWISCENICCTATDLIEQTELSWHLGWDLSRRVGS
jgi:hypothetical protein